ncbi:MAG: DUF3159 domain-containing protein [Candidatus Nanopelagicales bacterium]|jgi:hypothetical protein
MAATNPEPDPSSGDPDDAPAASQDLRAERLILERAIGGWRGMIDSGLPTVIFITVYVIVGRELGPALIAAVVAGVTLAGYRLVRRQQLQQVLTGFLGLAIAAGFSALTGQAENFFLPGLITNIAYGTAFIVSILIRWPLLGVAMGYLTGEGTSWRSDRALMRTYAAASWIWVGVFFGRLVVQGPLYLAGAVELLGVARVVMGWPLFLAGAYVTYRVLAPVYRAKRGM